MSDCERWEEIRDDLFPATKGDSVVIGYPPDSLAVTDACKRLAAQERELAEAQREAARLRRIAIDTVNETDGWCREDVSIAFLCGLANEVAAIKKQRDEARSELAEARRRVEGLSAELSWVDGQLVALHLGVRDKVVATPTATDRIIDMIRNRRGFRASTESKDPTHD